MGMTDKYELPWPAAGAFVDEGYADIKALADAVEAALRPPLLVTSGDGSTSWTAKVAEIGWDSTDDANRKRGDWDSTGNDDQLIIPSDPGWYMVAATVRFGGKSEPDWYDLEVRTRQVGDGIGAGTKWAGNRVQLPATTDTFTELCVSGIVRIADTTPRTGIAIRAQYAGASSPPDVGAGVNKLCIYRLSAL